MLVFFDLGITLEGQVFRCGIEALYDDVGLAKWCFVYKVCCKMQSILI